MGTMLPFDSIFMKAMEQSRAMDSNVTPPFHPGLYRYGSQPAGDPGRVQAMNTEYLNLGARDAMLGNAQGMQGGEGGAARSMPMYTPNSGEGYVYTPAPEQEANLGTPSPAYQEPETTDVIEQQETEVEQVARHGDIPQLLEALRRMASMQPGEGGNPVFHLDEMYKNSSATQGIPGTVAQYPTAGGITRETDYNL